MARDKKLRTVIMHDPELDDMNTIIRYLLYANEFKTEGIIYSSSQFHWKGDSEGTLFKGESEHTRYGIGPIAKWRWDDGSTFMDEAVEAYGEIYENLIKHAEGYPEPQLLKEKILSGNIEFPGDITKDSPGSQCIRELILDHKPGNLYLLTGAGQSTIGRALKSIEEEFKGSLEWKTLFARIGEKVIIQSFGDQDGVYKSYIGPHWPNIEFREMATMTWGYFTRKVLLKEDQQYVSAAWTKEHVSSIGPLGKLYMTWGDGRQMHKNDFSDYFGFSNVSKEQLSQMGYIPWYGESEEKGSWISEGDTSMYMNLLANGLDAHIAPSYGGWGGRNGEDEDPKGQLSRDYPSARWFGAAQLDFATRLKWSVTSEYKNANHPPIVELIDDDIRRVKPGEIVKLFVKAMDPDGDHLIGKWWQYVEAGSYPRRIAFLEDEDQNTGFFNFDEIRKTSQPAKSITYPFQVPSPDEFIIEDLKLESIEVINHIKIPTDATSGQTFHFIAEIKDYGNPSLKSYKRVVLIVDRKSGGNNE